MDAFNDFVGSSTFWRILLFFHFVMAVGLLATITLHTVAAWAPLQQPAGNVPADFVPANFIARVRSVPPMSYVLIVVILYVPAFLLGSWVYVKYRTYVRIPMEQIGHWKTVGVFEFKEHIVSMGLALLPAYWYFWRQPLAPEYASIRKWVTLFLAVTIWYSFLVGHTANDFRGVGA